MSARISPFGIKKLYGIVERCLEFRAAHTRLNGNCLVGLVKTNDLIEIFAHIQRYAAFYRLNAHSDGRATAVNVKRNFVFNAVVDNPFDFRRLGRIQNYVRQRIESFLSHSEAVVSRLSVSDRKPVVIGSGNVVSAHNFFKLVDMFFVHFGRNIKFYLIEADIFIVLFEIFVGKMKNILHHFI